jgi:hypothetical protein
MRPLAFLISLALCATAFADTVVRVADHGGEVVTVYSGDTVRWEGDFRAHPLVSADGGFTTVRDGSAFEKRYTAPGVYRYRCDAHPGAIGEVRVVERTVSRWYHDDCCGWDHGCCYF